MFKRIVKVMLAVLSCAALCHAEGAPLDLGATGITLAGYITAAATAGLAVFAGIFGIRVIVRAFSSVAG